MSLIAKSKGQRADPIPAGVYPAVCYGTVDLGTHLNPRFGKRESKTVILWEIPELRVKVERDGKQVDLPKAINKRYTISLHEKAALRKDLQSWRGRAFTEEELKGFHLSKVLGVSCMLNVIHAESSEGQIYANIAGIMPLPKSMPAMKAENVFLSFDIDTDEIPPHMPEWIAEIVKASDEWKGRKSDVLSQGMIAETGEVVADDDDVPF